MGVMSDEFDRAHWPFRARYYDDIGWTYHMCAAERIDEVREMTDVAQLQAALDVPELQATVECAIRKRLRELGHDAG